MKPQSMPVWRVCLLLGALAVGLFGLARADVVQAAIAGCRADPVFIMSDGTILDVQVDIATDVANVDVIQYIVHGPRNVSLVAAQSTPTIGFEGLEVVRYVADQPRGQFVTDTLVVTSVSNVRATSYSTFAGSNLWRLSLSAQLRVIEGWAGQHLVATLNK